ncbi:uncharacterized protein BDCG_02500 [Blastomyces dermatitidis ER-3]|uniref:Uncharacterized protein n=1 Tax=Ajellomyces dermatitidis (strain ER-3 / ATCC MYA-2586) TaxID=559297 RepID=A0ABP2EWJ9_AJEDR|nr:uncharacterized protein BDCG_02500 [Blastomyces dermatitidis ER-3]EEQ87380.2 hypothetical protein BDCG_02500 [Blastomyces dermatitidis ER-3]
MTTRPSLEIDVFVEFQLNLCSYQRKVQARRKPPRTAFDIASITTSSRVPTDRDDNPTSLRQFSVFANLSATFRDFAKLGEIASQLFMMPFVEVRAVNWRLMDVTAEKLAKEARKKPLMDAIEKANDFAETVHREVFPVEINDQGGSTSVSGPLHMARAMTARVDDPGSSGHSLDLEPQEITVRASIMAKFATADWKRPEGLRY